VFGHVGAWEFVRVGAREFGHVGERVRLVADSGAGPSAAEVRAENEIKGVLCFVCVRACTCFRARVFVFVFVSVSE
jgi:hypothetical protein